MTSSRWIRWRLVVACVALGAILPLVTLGQAMVNVRRIRSLGVSADAKAAAKVAADYLASATFSVDTLGTLTLWGVEIAVVLYGLSLAGLYLRGRLKGEQHG